MISSYRTVSAVLMIAIFAALMAGCGDVFRPTINVEPKPAPDPASPAQAIVLSTNPAGNGSNILIDGAVSLVRSSDSLPSVLASWIASGKSSAAAVMDMHQHQAPPDLRRMRRDVPKGLAAAVERALAKPRGERWPTATLATRFGWRITVAARTTGMGCPAACSTTRTSMLLFTTKLLTTV